MTGSAREARRIWTAPVLVAVATLVSLIGALVTEDAAWDGAAALLLFAALAASVGLGLRPAGLRRSPSRAADPGGGA